jgi:hypothetical protein
MQDQDQKTRNTKRQVEGTPKGKEYKTAKNTSKSEIAKLIDFKGTNP